MTSSRPSSNNDPAGSDRDLLVEAIKYISRAFGYHVTNSVVLTGLPLVGERLPINMIGRAAQNCGLSALPVQREVTAIPPVALPALALFKDSSIIVIKAIDEHAGTVDYIYAANTNDVLREPIHAFSQKYGGYAVFFKPQTDLAGRSNKSLTSDEHWFWGTIKLFWRDYLNVALAAFLINILALASPLFTMNVYDRVVPNFAIPTLWALAIGVILSLVFDGILKTARGQIINVTGKQADMALASRIFSHALAIDLEKRPASSGQFANHIKEFETVREFITSSSLVSLIDLMFIGIFVMVLFMIVGPIGFVPLIAVPIVVGISLLVQAPLTGAVERSHRESAVRHSILVESIANLDTIRALNAEGNMQRRWERSVAASGAAILSGRFWAILAQSGTGFVQALVSIVIVVWGVYLITDNAISMGGLIAAMMLSGRVLAPLASVAGTLTRLRQTIQAYKTLDTVMSTETERKVGRTYINRQVATGKVEFKDVSFRYPGASDDSLKKVSFKAQEGETIALIGRVGAGKTTIGRLMSGLYYPSNGAVLIDNTDTRQFDPADLRTGVGFVSQDNVLFDGTVRENISAGDPYAEDEAILEAARIAGVDDFIARHPLGYDLPVGEGGRMLSGGQRQSVALARMLLRKPKILFLDEPSSNLDLTSERRLIERLKAFSRPGTTVFISTHRMSLVELTDRILTLDNGQLAMDGPRETVLRQLRDMGASKIAANKKAQAS
ncbi:type I secretion system permease/ATPase [Breoghania sp.]|uniref:type I secretion system permease/ATPase n=1 Tax=Breoghania sp. TaxID=2065378 RepID=UPI002AAB16FD|nr:type I secretion system permease/ATPase [Breoghania sp.]